MFKNILKYSDFPDRLGMAAIFVLSGIGKLGAFAQTQVYMEAYGLPGALLVPTIAFEIGAGLALLAGLGTRFVAFLLFGFCLATAIVFHRDFGDQIQQIMLLKNIAMAGGLLHLAKTGAPDWSIDRIFVQ